MYSQPEMTKGAAVMISHSWCCHDNLHAGVWCIILLKMNESLSDQVTSHTKRREDMIATSM
jgi:hypothetical protein